MTPRGFAPWVAAGTLGLAVAVASATWAATPSAGLQPARWLSQTGLYSDPGTLTVAKQNRPFAPQYPLWTDGAAKRRWVRLPSGTAIDVRNVDAWEFPVGTRFWKEFDFGGRRVETRMLVKVTPARWQFASYVWNAAQTDAELAPAEGVPNVAEIAPGRKHSVPSIEECRACHDSNRTEVLGFTALQLSDDRDPGALHSDAPSAQALTLRTLVEERLMRPLRPEFVSTPPRIPASTPRTRAVLGYLSTNCGACHNAVGPLATLGLNFRQPAYGETTEPLAHAVGRTTKWDQPGRAIGTTVALAPGRPELSAMLQRMRSRRPSSQMPPLGTVVADHEAVELVTRWIEQDLPSDE